MAYLFKIFFMLNPNQNSVDLLKKCIERSNNCADKISFFILSWSNFLWKSEIAQNLSREILWNYFYNDFLHIKDFSIQLGKQHILKVEYNESNEISKMLDTDYSYQDLWVREINNWLQETSAWWKKIVLIENIERMNIASMNAFLKTCEEPLPGRIILATTSNKSSLLDTILSRSVVIPFREYSNDEISVFCDEKWYFSDNNELKNIVCMLSMGKPLLLKQYYEILSQDPDLASQFLKLIPALNEKNSSWIQYKYLSAIYKKSLFYPLMDGLIAYYAQNGDFQKSEKWLNVKKMSKTNVKVENLLFSALI